MLRGKAFSAGSENPGEKLGGWANDEPVRLYRKGAHYDHAKRLNSIVKNWGRYLVYAKSEAVYRALPQGYKVPSSTCSPQPETDLSHSPWLYNVTDLAVSSSKWTPHVGEGMLIGQFRLRDGRTALLLQNQNPDFTIWPTLHFHGAQNTPILVPFSSIEHQSFVKVDSGRT